MRLAPLLPSVFSRIEVDICGALSVDLQPLHHLKPDACIAETLFLLSRFPSTSQVVFSSVLCELPARRLNSTSHVSFGVAEPPTLLQTCQDFLKEHVDELDHVGHVPFHLMAPVIQNATAPQLYSIEEANPQFVGESEALWENHCRREFRGRERGEFETWRELYIRCHDEREAKLQAIQARAEQARAARAPARVTKLAYVEGPAKPPRNVRRAQERHGTAGPAGPHDPLGRLTSHGGAAARPPRPLPEMPVRVPPPPAKKPKVVAPLMKKTMQFIKSVPSLRRK